MNEHDEKYWRWNIVGILLITVVVYLLVEVAARQLVPRISKIDGRTTTEQQATNRLGVATPDHKSFLIVGNSLMRSGIDIPLLQEIMQPQWRVQRLIIESTDYLDWYYGLKSLFESGNRPTAVGLMLTARQLLAPGVRGEYTAYYLFSAGDTLRAGMRAQYHPTEIASMMVGHFSAYYGKRVELRKVAFQKVVPNAVELVAMLMPEPVARDAITDQQLKDLGGSRLAELRDLCAHYGVRLVFLTPTPQKSAPAIDTLVSVGSGLGLATDRLAVGFGEQFRQPDGSWPDEFFDTDHWHFSEAGARAYTQRLGPALKDAL